MAVKVDYDTDKRIIYVTEAPVNGEVLFDVKIDLYSDMKEDWKADTTLNKFEFPVRSVGGDALPGSKALGATFFLASDWKIRPYEADHAFRINGNLYSEDGTSVIIPTLGNYNVLIEMTVSNLSDSSIQQLKEIEYGVYGGGVTIDVLNGSSGTAYPKGTSFDPVDNIVDAVAIIQAQNLPKTIFIIGDLDITAALPSLKQYTFIGSGKDRTHLDIDANADVEDSAYYDSHVLGTLDGNSRLENCVIDNLIYIKGYIEQCVLSAGTIVLGGGETAHFLDCWSGVPGSGTPEIDMGGSGQGLALRNYNGGIKIKNKTGTDKVSVDLNSGQCILTSTVTNGEIVCRGVGKLIDESGNNIPSGTWNGVTIINETTKGSFDAIYDIVNDVLKATTYKVTRSGDIITIYESDEITVWRQYNLANKERIPI